jgi:hypothetical protein
MGLNGNVTTFPLSAIVRMIYEEKKTGQLMVTERNRRCRVYFREGKIVFADGNIDKELRLGELLRENNLIGETKLQEMLAVAQAMDKRLGSILIERGYVAREDLARILIHQVKEVVTKTMTWAEAKYTYADGLNGYVEDVRCELDPVRLVAEAERWKGYRDLIPNDQVVFQIKPGAMGSKSVHDARELRILLLIDGERTVEQIIKETSYPRLAVYRSLALLLSKGAVVRKTAAAVVRPAKADVLEHPAIIGLYTELLQIVVTDLAEEIGEKKALSSLESSMQQSAYYEHFLRVFQLKRDVTMNLGQIQAHIKQQGGALSDKDLIRGFNQVLIRIFHEQHRFLGPKATRNTVKRLQGALENVPAHQKLLASKIHGFLGRYESEELLQSGRKRGIDKRQASSGTTDSALPPLNLDKMGGSAIVIFYNDIIQLLMVDLQKEIGVKAQGLLQDIIKSSKYYDTFLSQFDLSMASGSNAQRIREHIKTQELRLRKRDLVQAFQQILVALLREENRLLGNRASDTTIARIVERMAVAQPQLKPLVNHLSAFLVSNKARLGADTLH